MGTRSLWATIRFEACMLLAPIPGVFGLALRKMFWPRLFGTCGTGVLFGPNMTIRHPHRIHIGDRVVFSGNTILDARNDNNDRVLVLGNDIICSDYVMISCRGANISIGSFVNISPQAIILATDGGNIVIGDDVALGPRCFVLGGGHCNYDRTDIPIWRQGVKSDSGVELCNDVWLGANVSVLSDVTIGSGTVAAAGAVIASSIPEDSICGGLPAKVLKKRTDA